MKPDARVLVFTTGTPDTIKLVNSVRSVAKVIDVVQYDVGPTSGPNHINMLNETRRRSPDAIVYIGAIKEIHHSWVPSTGELCEMTHVAPSVHLCSDAADPPWWPNLEDYDRQGAFTLQVTIDGALDCPIARSPRGMVALTPLHPDWFPARTWRDRPNVCGFAGGVGIRGDILGTMQNHNMLTHFGAGGHSSPYEELCQFYTTCKTVVNDARTGSQARRHMKGRFMEAAMAGAVVLEPADSIARQWFAVGEEFLEWNAVGDAPPLARGALSEPERYEAIGRRIREKVIAQHSAPVFWEKVFARMGL